MIKIENAETFGWTAAIRGMRNPMNSWEKSDSYFGCTELGIDCDKCTELGCEPQDAYFHLGSNDKDLMKRLRNAGTDHRKFMRMIIVYLDITAPLYWWKEFDTYKNVEIFDSSNDRLHYFFDDEYDIYNPDIDIDLLECRSFIERESSYWLVDFLGA